MWYGCPSVAQKDLGVHSDRRACSWQLHGISMFSSKTVENLANTLAVVFGIRPCRSLHIKLLRSRRVQEARADA